MTVAARLDPDRDLEVALSTAAEANRVIAAADAKTGLVLAAHGVVLAGMASSLRSGGTLPIALRFGAVAVIVVAGVAVLLLGAALWPRWGPSGATRFAFPGLTIDQDGRVCARPRLPQLAEQAWAQVDALATIARRKHRWFRAAIVVGAADLALFIGWLVLSSLG